MQIDFWLFGNCGDCSTHRNRRCCFPAAPNRQTAATFQKPLRNSDTELPCRWKRQSRTKTQREKESESIANAARNFLMWHAFRSNLRARLTGRQFARNLPHSCPKHSEIRVSLQMAQILFGHSEPQNNAERVRTGRLRSTTGTENGKLNLLSLRKPRKS